MFPVIGGSLCNVSPILAPGACGRVSDRHFQSLFREAMLPMLSPFANSANIANALIYASKIGLQVLYAGAMVQSPMSQNPSALCSKLTL